MSRYVNTPGENVWYYVINIFTFCSLYFVKVAVKKALSESVEARLAMGIPEPKEQIKKGTE